MRGKPLIQWIVFICLWLLLLYPLVLITARTNEPSAAAPEIVAEKIQTWISVRFSETPNRFELLQGEESLWVEDGVDALEYERDVGLIYNDSELDFTFIADLGGADAAIEFGVTPDGLSELKKTIWVGGHVHESMTFYWRNAHE